MASATAPAFSDLPEYERQAPFFNHASDAEPGLREEELREAVTAYVAENCCYGSGAAREMTLRDIQNTPIFVYTVELFLEERKAEWVTEPYQGTFLEPQQAHFSVPIDMWSIPVQPQLLFAQGHRVVEVPGTLSVVNCAQCSGIGSIQCGYCNGAMMGSCAPCLGKGVRQVIDSDGTTTNVACTSCRGSGRVKCEKCNGKGTTFCSTCKGFRRVKNVQKVEINWTTSSASSIAKDGRIKVTESMMDGLQEKLTAEELGSAPTHINSFNNFRSILEREKASVQALPNIRILNTRQRIYTYPGTEVVFNYKGRDEGYLVYGQERRVYFPKNYPQNCCWCRCSIL